MKVLAPLTLTLWAALAFGCGGTLKSEIDADSSTDAERPV